LEARLSRGVLSDDSVTDRSRRIER
jgi:hypothetical protein